MTVEVRVSTHIVGVHLRKVGALGEDEHIGKGALHRVTRDGVPHKGKIVVASGGGDIVPDDVPHSLDTREKAHSAYRRDSPCGV